MCDGGDSRPAKHSSQRPSNRCLYNRGGRNKTPPLCVHRVHRCEHMKLARGRMIPNFRWNGVQRRAASRRRSAPAATARDSQIAVSSRGAHADTLRNPGHDFGSKSARGRIIPNFRWSGIQCRAASRRQPQPARAARDRRFAVSSRRERNDRPRSASHGCG